MTTNLTDAKFDTIRKLPASALVGIRMGWSGDAALQALVSEYDAIINTQNSVEIRKSLASVESDGKPMPSWSLGHYALD